MKQSCIKQIVGGHQRFWLYLFFDLAVSVGISHARISLVFSALKALGVSAIYCLALPKQYTFINPLAYMYIASSLISTMVVKMEWQRTKRAG